ncbi:hypothetical protein ZEAMMB73_Zm00001d007595 [Zea mays]|uniref:Uncharacterized protein n=1 Tax=Zea mays TaxID=4577 RepID=A0A1D6F7D2_MAIZE|nr:hypothetical protein ZEAMMB73_Zm00001d007595 [Zea mays]
MVLAGLFEMMVLPALPAILAPNRRESCSPNLRWRRLHCRWRCQVCSGVCRWEGMVCSGSGQVVSLSLPFYGLTGTLSTAFGNLTFLRMLNLSSNSFRGEVLATIVRLAHLHALDLSYNAFSDAHDISQCNKISEKVLDGCVEEVGGYRVGYDIKLSGTESPRSVTGLEGVCVRVLFAWVLITGVEAADGEVTVHIGPIRKSFPAVGFKSSPWCIIGLATKAWPFLRVLDGCVEEVGGYHVGYDIKLSSTESPRSVTGLEGVRVRVLFAWVPITGVEAVDGEVTVHIGPIRKSFPAVGFKSSPRCIIRLEAWSLVMGWRLRIQANITDHNIKCMRQGKEANRCRFSSFLLDPFLAILDLHSPGLQVDAMLQELEKEIDDVDAQIGNRWQLLDKDHDGKVTPEEVAAATAYLKDTIGKEGVQELISNLSKDTGSFTYMLPQCCLCPIFLYFSERSLYALPQKEKILVEDIVKLASQIENNEEEEEARELRMFMELSLNHIFLSMRMKSTGISLSRELEPPTRLSFIFRRLLQQDKVLSQKYVLKYVAAQSPSQKSRQRLHQMLKFFYCSLMQYWNHSSRHNNSNHKCRCSRRNHKNKQHLLCAENHLLLLGKQQWHINLRRLNLFNLRPRSSVKHQRDLVQWHPQPPVAASAPKPGGSPKKGEVKPAVDPVQTPTTGADSTKPEPSAPSLPGAEGVDKMAIDEASGDAPEVAEELDPALEEEMSMEEMIRVTRAKLRRRTTTEVPAGN